MDSMPSNIFGDGVMLFLVGAVVVEEGKGEEFAIGLKRLGAKGFGEEEIGDDLEDGRE